MKRLGALVVAVALVVAAFVARSRLIDHTQDPIPGNARGSGTKAGPRVACDDLLASFCRSLDLPREAELRVEAPGTTLATLTATPDAYDIWLTVDPWPELLDVSRQQANADDITGKRIRLARSPSVVVAPTDRMAALRAACGGSFDWKCVGQRSGTTWATIAPDTAAAATWGVLRPAGGVPDHSVELLTLIGQVRSYFGSDPFGKAELDDTNFLDWLHRLVATATSYRPASGTALTELFNDGGGASNDLVPSLEAVAVPGLADAANRSRLTLERPSSGVVADVVAVPLGDTTPSSLERTLGKSADLTRMLTRDGWRPPSGSGTPPLPTSNGLPDPGVVFQIRRSWNNAG